MIRLAQSVVDSMLSHARSGYPNEACGILAGRTAGEASAFFPMRNMDESSISYFMDPKEQLQVFKKIRAQGLEMTGIFHSHVASPAAPSAKDVRLAFYAEPSYLIASLSDSAAPALRSFKIHNGVVTEEEVKVADGGGNIAGRKEKN